MTLAANAIQKGVYDRLKAQLADVAVYDHVPQGVAAPYIVIGNDTSIPWDTKTEDGQEITLTIHAWDYLSAGRKSVKTIMQRIYAALHRQEASVSVSGHALILMRCEYAETFQDTAAASEADHYYHGVMRFRALVHDA